MESWDVSVAETTSRGRIVSASIVLALSLVAATVALTGAIFTESDPVGSNTFTTGSVDISTSPTSNVISSATTMAPGDRVTGTVTVSNSGSLQLRYAVSGSATNTDSLDLRSALSLRIGLQASGSCDFPYHNTNGTTTTLTNDTQLYAGAFPTSTTASNLVGDVAQGDQGSDRALNASASEVLCFAAVLPLTAAGPQSATTTATINFVAEQTANN